MKITNKKSSRHDQILDVLVNILKTNPGARVTTASLAEAVGITEAAIYRHFPSKAKIFESLIDQIEAKLFENCNEKFLQQGDRSRESLLRCCEKALKTPLELTQDNPGICSLLCGNALVGDLDHLRGRVNQIYNRFEDYLQKLLETGMEEQHFILLIPIKSASDLLTSHIEGRLHRFIRSDFALRPLQDWDQQWMQLSQLVFDNSFVFRAEETRALAHV